jgi:uncharacterized protein
MPHPTHAYSLKQAYTLKWIRRIAEVDPPDWDALAEPLKTPLLEWEWLHQLEESGSIAPEAGWHPRHLTVWNGGRLVAAAPLYIKTHSAGEFVFDHIWAELAGKLGIRYYPKLVGMSPVTPITGYRFLMAPGMNEAALTRSMLQAIDRFCTENTLSGCSFLFSDPDWQVLAARYGYVKWLHQSFVWENRSFDSFEDYLGIFKTNQRRNIRRERNMMAKQGIRLEALEGDEIPHRLIPLMFRYYEATNDQHGPWGCKYLNPTFFEGIYRTYRHRMLVIAAYHRVDSELPVGMSLLIHKGEQLLGRYWGAAAKIRDLHFNACYYRPIEWAIQKGVRYFDPGAGGHHKTRRGFRGIGNYSLHKFYDHRLEYLMRAHIGEINRMEQDHIDALNEDLPLAQRE